MGAITYPTNNYLDFCGGELSECEKRLTTFCQSIDFKNCPQKSGAARRMFSWVLWTGAGGANLFCLYRVIMASSQEYKVDPFTTHLAISTTIGLLFNWILSPKNLSESDVNKKEIFRIWRRFNRAYSNQNSKDMRGYIKILENKKSLFPREFQSIIGLPLQLVKFDKKKDFPKCVKLIKAISYIYEMKNVAESQSSKQMNLEEKPERVKHCFKKAKKYFEEANIHVDAEKDGNCYTIYSEYVQNRLPINTNIDEEF